MRIPLARSAQFASALSDRPDWRSAVDEITHAVRTRLDGPATWAAVFVSNAWTEHLPALANRLAEALGTPHVVGCTAESLVGRSRELEWRPGISVLAARMPTSPLCFSLEYLHTPDGGTFVGWPDEWLDQTGHEGTLLILADPFSFPTDYLLERLAEDHPKLRAAGGMASGATAPGESRLLRGQSILNRGAVVCYFSSAYPMAHIVSQGCRPIGHPLVITRAERNLLYELGGKPALAQLQAIFDELPNHEKELLREGLHLGRVVNEYQERFEAGDFLIRNVLGVDRASGALVVADSLRIGQTVQFHIRDPQTADAELHQLLLPYRGQAFQGGLLFTCNGRGTRMFPSADHDARAISQALGDVPLAGFFAQGEIGPIGNRNFVHGFTASLLLFRDPDTPAVLQGGQ